MTTEEKKIEKLARAIWRYYYPDGGSRYKDFDSLPQWDKDIHKEEAKEIAKFLDGKAFMVNINDD